MTGFVTTALLVSGSVVAGFSLYLLVLAGSAFFYSPSRATVEARARLVVLIPAHDEALTIAGSVGSLCAQSYPRALYEIVVVADNCSDETAEIAKTAGADAVLQRRTGGAVGKGRALRWAIDSVLAGDEPPDALVIVDADAAVERDALARLAEAFEGGAHAAQGDNVLVPDASASAALRATAFLLINRVRPAGRAALGLSAFLVGNGMLLSSQLLRSVPWEAFTSTEDLEYSLDLQTAGHKIAYVGGARVRTPTAPNSGAAAQQQLRWEGGRNYLMRTRGPRLLWHGLTTLRPGLIWAAFDLLTPPLGALAGIALTGLALSFAAVAAGICATWTLAPWLLATIAIPCYVLVGLRAAGAPGSAYRALIRAPGLVLSKASNAGNVLRFRADSWVRTERAADEAGEEL
ncbi:MAG TPA: glycosyltransferase family 2 protein [Solirubrobacteraceae bacterium]|jgi:cellulose synthase/poly-beta-1,6-N-acetylglucosamine synthase-like glycosyltransferase|nr:glycosyltransferase family 2 protein [Solirubrobacteraceae bacterium]